MTVVIERLGHHGDGIGAGPDGPVFAPMTLPGEVITGTITGERMADPRVLTASPDRVAPPCPHYRACGACVLQHAADGFVARWKAGVVEQALAAHDIAARVEGVATSPPASRRRAVLAGRRTRSGVLVGFHARASDQIVAVPGCTVLDPGLVALIPALERLVAQTGTRKGAMDLAVTLSEGGADLAVTGGKPMDAGLFAELSALADAEDLARLTWEGQVVATRRPPQQRLGPARVAPPPGAFLQATPQGQAALVASVLQTVDQAARVADLFAGCGTFALPIARKASVHAVEGDAAMLAALDRGWRDSSGLHALTHEARDLFRRPLLPDELARFDAIVIDPPRAGASAQIAQIAAARVPVLAYVSCNPVTFARDAATLAEAGYQMDRLRVVDQFRWSSHVELVARFRAA
ncbi:class I SAM-dependent RNA methyltransferase [Paracoccus sp. p4-l81]|uniref:class I SAM-dependent RNA methyltransferase n=1 Tax=Paracoccus sp. p4-l81 TaxID=3342806 RepID=UPI0035B90F47